MTQNINKLLKQAQKMQSDMMKVQDEIAKKEIEGTAGGGMVTVTMNGSFELLSVKIKKDVVDPEDIEMLEDLIIAAVANAHEKAKQMSESALGGITAGMKIPGLM